MGWKTFDDDMRQDYELNPRYCDICGTRLEWNPVGPDCPNPNCPRKVGFPSGMCQRCGGTLREVDRSYGYTGGDDHGGLGRACRVTYKCERCGASEWEQYDD